MLWLVTSLTESSAKSMHLKHIWKYFSRETKLTRPTGHEAPAYSSKQINSWFLVQFINNHHHSSSFIIIIYLEWHTYRQYLPLSKTHSPWTLQTRRLDMAQIVWGGSHWWFSCDGVSGDQETPENLIHWVSSLWNYLKYSNLFHSYSISHLTY